MKFKCKKVEKIRFYHNFIAWFARIFLKTEIFYCTLETLKKELSKRKRMVKNIKRLLKEPPEVLEKEYPTGIQEIKKWQKEVDIMEEELQKWF